MSNTVYIPKNKNIDRRTKNIVHLSDGSIKYDFNKYNSYIEAIYADYIDCRTDEQLKESISLCFADSLDQKVMFKKLKLQFLSALANTDKASDMKPVFLTNMLAFIACDEDECLHLFTSPPVRGFFNWESNGVGHCFDIDESYCEDLGIDVPTWDDEPTEVEIDIHISKHEE